MPRLKKSPSRGKKRARPIAAPAVSVPAVSAPAAARPRVPAFKPPRYIAVEGPIRVGKSTLAKSLADRLHARRVFDCEDNPFLADFYREKPGAAFRAQMYFLDRKSTRLNSSHIQKSRMPSSA